MNKSHRRKIIFHFLLASLFSAYACLVYSPINTRNARAQNSEKTEKEYAKAECVMELNTRRVLYESHGDIRLPMASTTKIATAATVLSLCKDVGAEYEVPKEAEGIEGSSVYLKAGEKYSVEDLLYGLMLRSGNDCAVALACYCCGNVENFSAQMNETAQKAGAMATNFRNPHGLPCDGHYTTARDLTAITCYALENETFRQIVSTQYYSPRNWKNKNKMLNSYDGAIGVKTGYTKQAGRCLVSAAERESMTLVCTVLNCPAMYERSASLLDDAFSAYEYVEIVKKGVPFEIKGQRCATEESFSYPLLKEEKELLEIQTAGLLSPQKGANGREIIGKIEIKLLNRLLFSGNLYKL